MIKVSVYLNRRVFVMLYRFRDTVPHVPANQLNTDLNKKLVHNITKLMKEQFPSVPIYATFGNHDYYPRDQFPPHNNDIYNSTYLIWKSWIDDVLQEQYFLKGKSSIQTTVLSKSSKSRYLHGALHKRSKFANFCHHENIPIQF